MCPCLGPGPNPRAREPQRLAEAPWPVTAKPAVVAREADLTDEVACPEKVRPPADKLPHCVESAAEPWNHSMLVPKQAQRVEDALVPVYGIGVWVPAAAHAGSVELLTVEP